MQRLRRLAKGALFVANAKLTLASWPQEANNLSIVVFVTCAYAKNAQVVDKWLLQKVQQPREVEMDGEAE